MLLQSSSEGSEDTGNKYLKQDLLNGSSESDDSGSAAKTP